MLTSTSSSKKVQKQAFTQLSRNIKLKVNAISRENLTNILSDILALDLHLGRGLISQALIDTQMASPSLSDVLACLLSIINSKYPEIGEITISRLILQWNRSLRKKMHRESTNTLIFLSHCVVQKIVHPLLIYQFLASLLYSPTNDSIILAVTIIKTCGAFLIKHNKKSFLNCIQTLSSISSNPSFRPSHSASHSLSSLFKLHRSQQYPPLSVKLDLVHDKDQFTHRHSLLNNNHKSTADLESNHFTFDADFDLHVAEFLTIKAGFFGSDDDGSDDDGSGNDHSQNDHSQNDHSQNDHSQDDGTTNHNPTQTHQSQKIHHTLVSDSDEEPELSPEDRKKLKSQILIILNNSHSSDEAAHKLVKLDLKLLEQKEVLLETLIEKCAKESTFLEFFPRIASKITYQSTQYQTLLMDMFVFHFQDETNNSINFIRNSAQFFGHLLSKDTLPWIVLENIKLLKIESTQKRRIFLKSLFEYLKQKRGLKDIGKRLNDPSMEEAFKGLFPVSPLIDAEYAQAFWRSLKFDIFADKIKKSMVL